MQPAGALTDCFPVRVLKMAIDPTDTDHMYAALEVGGVIRSLDGGESWEDISAGLIELSREPHLSNCILSDDLTEGMMDLHGADGEPRTAGNGLGSHAAWGCSSAKIAATIGVNSESGGFPTCNMAAT